jgi:hypothetical protein
MQGSLDLFFVLISNNVWLTIVMYFKYCTIRSVCCSGYLVHSLDLHLSLVFDIRIHVHITVLLWVSMCTSRCILCHLSYNNLVMLVVVVWLCPHAFPIAQWNVYEICLILTHVIFNGLFLGSTDPLWSRQTGWVGPVDREQGRWGWIPLH